MVRRLLALVFAVGAAGCGLASEGDAPTALGTMDATADHGRSPPSDATLETATRDVAAPDVATALDSGTRDSGPVDTGIVESTDTAGPDASTRDSAPETTTLDSAPETTGGAMDARGDCGPPPTVKTTLTAHQAPPSFTLDGNLDDWPCDAFVALNASNGFVIFSATPFPAGGQFAVLWDQNHIYVAAQLVDEHLLNGGGGNNAGLPWQNVAVELYFSGDADPNGTYTSNDHQFIVDWKNLAVEYQNQIGSPPSPAFTWAVQVSGDTMSVEVSVETSAIGMSQLDGGGTSLGFDVAFDDGNGTALNAQVVWDDAAHGACGCIDAGAACCCVPPPQNNSDQPSCDVLRFGKLNLQP